MTGPTSLYGDLFQDRRLTEIFSDRATLQAMLDFEAVLATAQAELGIIPASAVAPITAACRADLLDIGEIGRQATLAGNPAIPMVKILTAEVAHHDREASRWVHWGATSQDVIDSGRALQFQAALEVVGERCRRLAEAIGALVRTHRHTIMPGRTLLQHALPITFGLKAAYWLDALFDHMAGIAAARPAFPAPLGGAAGTLASLGTKGGQLQEHLARALAGAKPVRPPVPYHTTRQGIARLACELGLLTGTLGKIARDVMLLMQTEVSEVFEPAEAGKGGSSALPHKRNPVQSLAIAAIAERTPGLVATMLSAMTQEHERAVGGWHAEWQVMADLFVLTGAALNHAMPMLEGLEVDAARMRANLDLTQGLVLSERVALALGERIGRMEAKSILEEASRTASVRRVHLKSILAADERVTRHLTTAMLDDLFDPATYLGAAQTVIDRVLSRIGNN